MLTSMNSIKLIGNNCKMLELTLMLILRFVLFRVSIVSYLDFICFIVAAYISANQNFGFAFEYCLVELLLFFYHDYPIFRVIKLKVTKEGGIRIQ